MKSLITTHAKKTIFTLLILVPVILLLLRVSVSPTLPGTESYDNLLIASSIQDDSLSTLTSSSPNLYHYLLAPSPKILSIILPTILMIITILLLPPLLKKLDISPKIQNISLIMLILSPLFLSLIFLSTPLPLILLINVAGLLLLSQKKATSTIIALILFATIPLFGPLHVAILILTLLCFSTIRKKIFTHGPIVAIFITLESILYYTLSPPNISTITPKLTNLFVELGSWYGMSIFYLLLAILGLLYLWRQKKTYYPLFLFLAIAIATTIWFPQAGIYLYIPLHILAAYGFLSVMTSKWELPRLKKLSLYLILLGILISTIASASTLSRTSPNPQQIDALIWLEDDESKHYTALSHSSRSSWIQTVAKKKTLSEEDSLPLLQTSNLATAIELIAKHDITYIFIDNEMKNSLVWSQPDQGLLFLLRNEETFKRVHKTEYTELWQVKS